MITRRNKINLNAKEVQLSISFTSADVKHWVRHLMSLGMEPDPSVNDQEHVQYIRSIPWTEHDLLTWAKSDPAVFRFLDEPWRSSLAAWLLSRIVAEGYIEKSPVEQDKYYISAKGGALYRRNFRPEYFTRL